MFEVGQRVMLNKYYKEIQEFLLARGDKVCLYYVGMIGTIVNKSTDGEICVVKFDNPIFRNTCDYDDDGIWSCCFFDPYF